MRKAFLLVMLAVVLASCAPKGYETPGRVIFIGIDGWSSASFEKGEFPFVREMMKQGSWTLDKRCVFPTASAINWMSIFSGVAPEWHGYVNWGSRRPDLTPAWTDERGEVPTIFYLERKAHPESDIVVTYQWDVIRSLIDSTAVTECVEFPESYEGDIEEAQWAADYIQTHNPHFSFVYFGTLDHTGHQSGWESDEYLAWAEHLDAVVKDFVEATDDGNTVFVLTADHGGSGTHHSSVKANSVLQTPLVIWGKGIKQGHQIQVPTGEMDVTATLAKLLGVEPLPHWTGRCIEEVFE